MNIKEWCALDEIIYNAQNNEQYRQYAGFDFSKKLIEKLAEMKLKNSEIFISHMSNQQRSLLVGSVEDIAYSKTKKLELELHDTRNNKITSTKHVFNDSKVNWSTWRQFNSFEINSNNRKEVFDEFINKTKYIAPIIEKRFYKIREVYEEYQVTNKIKGNGRLDPVSGYLEDENISYEQLLEFIKALGKKAKKPFREELRNISKKILEREPEYYDDFYFFRNKIYSSIDKEFVKVDPIIEVKKILKNLEFDISKIYFDIENRKNKYPSPICFFVKIPDDVRILYKRENPYFDLQGCFHETGHAIHATSIDKDNHYWDKYRIPMGIAEIFSIFLEGLTQNRSYLNKVLFDSTKYNDDTVLTTINARNKFMELFFITFYVANSLMKLEYWGEKLSIDEANKLYSKLIREYTGFEMPGEYWLLHHILPESLMYVPSYLLAAVRASELEEYIKNRFGDLWWRERKAGIFLREIMSPGARIDLSIFSKLDTNMYLKNIL